MLFDELYRVERAALIPVGVVRLYSTFTAHTNSYRFPAARRGVGRGPGHRRNDPAPCVRAPPGLRRLRSDNGSFR